MQIVTTHKNTDFDALAATIAAQLLYSGASAVLPRSLNPNVKGFLSIHKDHFPTVDPKRLEPDCIKRLIVVDTNRWDRLDHVAALRRHPDLEIFMWDHHRIEGDIEVDWKCQENTGATVTLLVRNLKEHRKHISPIQATLFLAGIYEDTGNLSFSSTTAADVHAAAYLLERGADLSILGNFLRPAYGEKQKNVLFEMLQHARRTSINGYKISINTQPVDGYVDNLALVVAMYQDILNVDAAFGIFPDTRKDHCMVIGRSQIDAFDVGTVMRSMGGGGHPGAGSALLKSVRPVAVEEWVFELLRGNQQASVQIGDLMSFPVHTVSQDTSMEETARLLRSKGCTGVPVVGGECLVGIISRRDFQRIRKESQLKAPVKAFMSPRVLTIEPGKSPMQAARLMIKHDVGRLPVVADGRILGIVTRSDVMTYFYDLLPD